MWRLCSFGIAATLLLAACSSPVTTPFASSPVPTPASAAPSQPTGACPTLEDYTTPSQQPSATLAPPSFEPVAPDATASTGLLALGETGILPAADGSPGVLVRVSNARFCDRLPDYRPEIVFFLGTLLLADVDVQVLQAGVIRSFIAGSEPIIARYADVADGTMAPMHFGLPGANLIAKLDPRAGFSYRGTMAWEIGAGDGRVTVDVQQPSPAGSKSPVTVFAFLVRDGSVGPGSLGSPEPTSDPSAIATTGEAGLGERVVLAADGGTMPVVVDGVEEVTRYTGVAPAEGDAFLEMRLVFGPGSGTFAFDPAEWVVTDLAGTALPQLRLEDDGSVPPGWPWFAPTSAAQKVSSGWSGPPFFMIAEVPAGGRITLEYRPAGRETIVHWVLRRE